MVMRRPGDLEPDVTERVVTAAFELFAADGYEATTVEAITQRAGVARRTFFRYFRSKEDVIFPDHEALLAEAAALLATLDDRPPVEAVCRATSVVFAHYLSTPERSVERFRLTREVPALRAREIASVHAYHRVFTRYLIARLADEPQAPLRAEVIAGAVIAAHNQVLREWLRGGGLGSAARGSQALDEAFGYVLATFERAPRRAAGRPRPREAVVVVVSTDASPQALADRIRGLV
jgi:AcrR family transcriptional regulator